MSRLIGWTLPIISDDGLSYVLGDEDRKALSTDQLRDLDERGLVTLFSDFVDVDGDFSVPEDVEVAPSHVRRLLYPYHVFYWSASVRSLGIDPLPSGVAVDVSRRSRLATLVTSGSLLDEVERLCEDLHCLVSERMVQVFRAGKPLADAKLRDLARCYHDLAYNSDVARRAIVRRAFLIHHGRTPERLEEWLEAAAKVWGLSPNIEEWTKRIRSLRLSIETSDAFAFHNAIRDLARRPAEEELTNYLNKIASNMKPPQKDISETTPEDNARQLDSK